MTLVLPAFLPPPLVTLAAGNFPEGLEDVMEEVLTVAHQDTEAVLRTAAELQTELAQWVLDSATGTSGAAAAASMFAAAETLSDLAESEGQLADHMEIGARDIEFEKLLVIFSLLILAAQLALAVAFPGGALVVAARWVATRQTIQSAFLQLLARLTLKGTALLEAFPWASVLVRGGGSGAFQGAGADLAAQHVQIDGDTRAEVDKKSVWVSTASGFAGGVAGDAAARWAEPAVRRLAVRATDGQWGQQAISVVMLGGIGGVAGAPAGLIAATVASGRSLTDLKWDDWREGVISGFGGGVIGAAGYAIRSPGGPMPSGAGERGDAPRPAGPGPGLERMRAWASSELDRTVVPDRSETTADPRPNKKGTVFAEAPGVVRTENVPHRQPDSVSPTNSGSGNSVADHPVRPADPVQPPQSENVAPPAETPTAPGDPAVTSAAPNAVPPLDSGAEPGVGPKQQPWASTGDFDAPPEQSTQVDPAANGAEPHPDRAVDAPTAATDSGIPTPESVREHTETGLPAPDRSHRISEESESGAATTRPPETVHGSRPDQQQDATPSAAGPAPQDGSDAAVVPATGPNQPPQTTPPAARVPRTPDTPAKPESGSENTSTSPRIETPAEPVASVFPPQDRTRPESSVEPTSSSVTAPEHSPAPPASESGRAVPPADSGAAPGQNADPSPGHSTTAPPTEGVEPASRPEAVDPTDRRSVPIDQFDPLEDIELQRNVEAALRDSSGGFSVGADPRVNPYGGLINGGSPDKPGRGTNCVETSLCAISSYHGMPLAAKRLHDDGTVSGRFGQEAGPRRARLWAGKDYREIGPGESAAEKYRQLYNEVAAAGPMSAALVGIGWTGSGANSDTGNIPGHMIVLVHPPGPDSSPVFWDAQSGETWTDLPEKFIGRTARVDAIVLSPEEGRRAVLAAESLATPVADSPTAPPRSAATPAPEQEGIGDRKTPAYAGRPPDAEGPGRTPAMSGTTPDPSEYRDFGRWLRGVADARGLRPADLANACGTHPNNVYRWLGDYVYPNLENQQRLRVALHIPDEVWATAAARYALPDEGYRPPPARPPESAADVDWSGEPANRETAPEPLARIRDITADNAATVRIMMNQWLGSWSSDSGYVGAIADAVAAAVSATTGAVEVVVRPQGSAAEGGGREVTVIDRQPGRVNSRAETVWRLPLSPGAVEPVTTSGPADPAQAAQSQTDPQRHRTRAESKAKSFTAELRKTSPWLTTGQIHSAGKMFTELYANALIFSPTHAVQVSVREAPSGELGQSVRVTVSHEISEGVAAHLAPWGTGREPGPTGGDRTAPTVHAHSDVNSRRIELRPGGRTVEHAFEIHKGSLRQAADSAASGPATRPPSADPPVAYEGPPPESTPSNPDADVISFESPDSARAYAEQHWGDGAEYRTLLDTYTTEGAAINRYLRGDPDWRNFTRKPWSQGDVDAIVTQLNSVMKPLPDAVAALRHVEPRHLSRLRRGEVVEERGFLSTTPDPGGLSTFRHRRGVLDLTVPPGIPVAFLRNGTDNELLLPPGTRWRVVDSAETADGTVHVHGVVEGVSPGVSDDHSHVGPDRGGVPGRPPVDSVPPVDYQGLPPEFSASNPDDAEGESTGSRQHGAAEPRRAAEPPAEGNDIDGSAGSRDEAVDSAWSVDSGDLIDRYVGVRPPSFTELWNRMIDLEKRYPNEATLRPIGFSGNGVPLEVLSIAGSSKNSENIVIVVDPHPMEQIGRASALAFAEHVLANPDMRADASYHFMVSFDPDSAMLNSRWPEMEGPVDITQNHLSFHRGHADHQPEWRFGEKGTGRARPESAAFMKFIDSLSRAPALMFSLHNAAGGGAYSLVASEGGRHADIEGMLAGEIESLSRKFSIPIEKFPAGTAKHTSLGSGVRRYPPISAPDAKLYGSVHYIAERGGIGFIIELPQWDTQPMTRSREEYTELVAERIDVLDRILDRLPQEEIQRSSFGRAAVFMRDVVTYQREKLIGSGPIHGIGHIHWAPLRSSGMLLRAIDELRTKYPDNQEYATLFTELGKAYKQWSREAETELQPKWNSLHSTGGFQLGFMLDVTREVLLSSPRESVPTPVADEVSGDAGSVERAVTPAASPEGENSYPAEILRSDGSPLDGSPRENAEVVYHGLQVALESLSNAESVDAVAERVSEVVAAARGEVQVRATLPLPVENRSMGERSVEIEVVDSWFDGAPSSVRTRWELNQDSVVVERAVPEHRSQRVADELDAERAAALRAAEKQEHTRKSSQVRQAVTQRVDPGRPDPDESHPGMTHVSVSEPGEVFSWLSREHVETIGVMFGELHANAAIHAPDHVGETRVESGGVEGQRWVRFEVSNNLAEGQAARLKPWSGEQQDVDRNGGRGTSIVHRLSDGNGRDLWLGAEDRSVTHWFEIHEGSSRYEGKDDDAGVEPEGDDAGPEGDLSDPDFDALLEATAADFPDLDEVPDAGPGSDPVAPGSSTDQSRRVPVEAGVADPVVPPVDYQGPPPELPHSGAGPREEGGTANQIISPIREMAGLPPDSERQDIRRRSARSVEQIESMHGRRRTDSDPTSVRSDYDVGVETARSRPASDTRLLLENVQRAPGGARLVIGGGHAFRNAELGEVFLNMDPEARPDIVAHSGDLSALPDSTFTEVYFERVGRVAKLSEAAIELCRVLQPGGHLSIVTGRNAIPDATERNVVVQRLRHAGFENIDYTVLRDNLFDPDSEGDSTWNEISADKPTTLERPTDGDRPDRSSDPANDPSVVWEDDLPVLKLGPRTGANDSGNLDSVPPVDYAGPPPELPDSDPAEGEGGSPDPSDSLRAGAEEDGRHPGSSHGTAAGDTLRESPGYIARSGRDTDDGSAPGVREAGVAPNRNISQRSVIRETLRSYRRSVPDDGRVIAVDARGRALDDRKLPAYEVRRFGGVDSAVMVLEVRVHGTVDTILSRRGAQNVVEHVQRVIDNSLNLPGGVLPTGDRLLVDVVPTNDPDNAHLRVQAGQRGAGPGVWSDRDGPDIVVDRLRRQLGLHPVGVGGTSAPGFSPDDLRVIADDIAAARPTDTNSLSTTRVIGPGNLDLLEKDSYRTRVEDALRAGDGYLRWADPSKNAYGSLINDGGPGELGRFNNCVDCVLSALDSFYGRPQVAHPRWSDPTSERSKGGLLAGEFRGAARIAGALGKAWRNLGESKLSVSGQLNALQREVADMKQGAVAVVHNFWQARDPRTGRALFTAAGNPKVDGSHVTLCVYPKGESGPVWWDPQYGATSRKVPPELAMESASIHCITLPPNADVLGGEKASALAERAERPAADGAENHPAASTPYDIPFRSHEQGADPTRPGDVAGTDRAVDPGASPGEASERRGDPQRAADPGDSNPPSGLGADHPVPAEPGDGEVGALPPDPVLPDSSADTDPVAAVAEIETTVDWDRAHGFAAEPAPGDLPTARVPALNPAERWALAGRYAEEIEGWQASPVTDHVVGPAEREYTKAYEKVRSGWRTPWSPPPTEEAARLAGRQAVDRYLRRVGPEAAQVAFDVVRAHHGGSELHWGRLWRTDH